MIVNFRLLWAGLWLLIMLQFTNVVATSVSILNCPMMNDFDGRNSLVCVSIICFCKS